MNISFHGAARTVTGSKHLLTLNSGTKVLLDCGMFQGMGLDTLALNQQFGFEPSEVDMVILSHAHVDHIGLLPRLVKGGFHGPIYCTEATKKLAEILLRDSAYIQENDVKHVNKRKAAKGKPLVEPLYNLQDASRVFPLMEIKSMNEWHELSGEISLQYKEAGHILGSATVHLKIKENNKEKCIAFSGDIGRYNDDLLPQPVAFPQADYILLESTYGNELHPPFKPTLDLLLKYIEDTCIKKGGKLIIPAFSVGRTQELLYALNMLELENRLPNVPYYLDSPMSIEVTGVAKQYPKLYNQDVQDTFKIDSDPFMFEGLKYVENVGQSKKLNVSKEPCVIISASGMAEAGRVKHHIMHAISDPRNTILMVGYCEPQSLGGRLLAGNEEVGIYGDKYEVKADIGKIDSLSAHGDYKDLMEWLSCQDPQQIKRIFLVHGEYEVQQIFREKLLKADYFDVSIPELHQRFEI